MSLFFSVLFRKIKFGNNSSSQYLISITNQYLTVWNLLSCTGEVKVIVFLYQLAIKHLGRNLYALLAQPYWLFSSTEHRKSVSEVARSNTVKGKYIYLFVSLVSFRYYV